MSRETPPMATDKAGLLEQIARYRAALEAALQPLNDDQMTAAPGDGWSIKDHLAHITAWEQSIVALLRGRPRHEGLGVEASVYLNDDIDETNRQIYEQNHDSPLAGVLADFRMSYQQLWDTLDGLTDADLHLTYSHYLPDEPGEEDGAPVLHWVAGNTFAHYAEHLGQIQALREQALPAEELD